MAKVKINRTLQQSAINRFQLQDELEAIDPDVTITARQAKDAAGNVSNEIQAEIECAQELRSQIISAIESHTANKTEDETKQELATKPTEKFKKLFIETLKSLNAQERAQFKLFLQGL